MKKRFLTYSYTNQNVIHIATAKKSMARIYCSLLLITTCYLIERIFHNFCYLHGNRMRTGKEKLCGEKAAQELGTVSSIYKSSYISTLHVLCHLLLFPTKGSLLTS